MSFVYFYNVIESKPGDDAMRRLLDRGRYLFRIIMSVLVLIAAGCGDEISRQAGAAENTPSASESGSAIFSIQWHPSATDRSMAGALGKPAEKDCAAVGVASITCEVFDESHQLIAACGPWPCDTHNGRIENIIAGADRTFAVSGWNAADAGGDIVYQGRTAGVTIVPGEITDAGVIDAYAVVSGGHAAAEDAHRRIEPTWTISAYDALAPKGEGIIGSAQIIYSLAHIGPLAHIGIRHRVAGTTHGLSAELFFKEMNLV